MYGYRYTETSAVFPLPGLEIADATAEVEHRRAKQTMRGNPATVELVEETGTGWRPVSQRAEQFRAHQLELDDTTPTAAPEAECPHHGDDIGRVLAELATLPRRSGRSRRRR